MVLTWNWTLRALSLPLPPHFRSGVSTSFVVWVRDVHHTKICLLDSAFCLEFFSVMPLTRGLFIACSWARYAYPVLKALLALLHIPSPFVFATDWCAIISSLVNFVSCACLTEYTVPIPEIYMGTNCMPNLWFILFSWGLWMLQLSSSVIYTCVHG